jgi:hypothetical protein
MCLDRPPFAGKLNKLSETWRVRQRKDANDHHVNAVAYESEER